MLKIFMISCFLIACYPLQTEEIATTSHANSITISELRDHLLFPTSEESRFSTTHIPFIANVGQKNKRVEYYARTFGGTVFITKDGKIVYSFPVFERGNQGPPAIIEEELVNGKTSSISGVGRTYSKVNSYKGKNRSNWKNDIPTYDYVSFSEVYEGIEFRLKATLNNVEKLFFVHPKGDPKEIKVRVGTQYGPKVNVAGELVITTVPGPITFTRPEAFQIINGERIEVPARYCVDGNTYGFTVGEYDRNNTLVIDPLISSTFLGGSSSERAQSIAVDTSGNVFIFGSTLSADFPTSEGSFDESYNGSRDTFVCKFSSDLTTLIASAFIGGAAEDSAHNIKISSSGSVYLMGSTYSEDFPVSSNAIDNTYNGNCDLFVTKLNNDLTQLLESGFVGGSSVEGLYYGNCDLDENDNLFLVTMTSSTDFPATADSYDSSHNGGSDYAIVKINSALTEILASSYLGGVSNEEYPSLVLDSSGNAFVLGTSRSRDFPTTAGAYNRNLENDSIIVSKLDNDLSHLLSSTAVGTDATCFCIAVDEEDNIFISGHGSSGWPTTGRGWDITHSGTNEGLITKLSNDLSRLLATTFLRGHGDGFGLPVSIITDDKGHLYAVGNADEGFPTTAGAYSESHNGGLADGFITAFDTDLETLYGSTLVGGNAGEIIWDLAPDPDGNFYCVGSTSSQNFPVTADAVDRSFNGGENDVFVLNITGSLTARGSDLKNISTKISPKKLKPGADITLMTKITNLSSFYSLPSRITFYLSKNKKIGKKAFKIDSADLAPVAGNKVSRIKYKTTFPGKIPPGEYYLISFVDYENRTYDPNRKNNVSSSKKRIVVY